MRNPVLAVRRATIALALGVLVLLPGCLFTDDDGTNVTLLNADPGSLPIHIFTGSDDFGEHNRLDPGETREVTVASGSQVTFKAGRNGLVFAEVVCTEPESDSRLDWNGTILVAANYTCTTP